MRILLLSWEYPPRIVGGLGRHVYRLSTAFAAAGHDVHVVTREHPDAPMEEIREGVHVVRAGEYPPIVPFDDLFPWVLAFNLAVQQKAAQVLLEHEIDVVHAHDWLVAYAAAGVRDVFDVPVVSTIHATEFGRHQGHLPNDLSKLIHQVEWWLAYESRRTITCSNFMRDEVKSLFSVPDERLRVIPNGVDLDVFARRPGVEKFRAARLEPGEKMIFFAGRLEFEKGVQTVLDALPRVLKQVPVRFFVAGVGTHADELRQHVRRKRLASRVEFVGFVPDGELRRYYAAADLAVVPSLYEPFGMVALETMASGTPCIAADTGGLREIVVHEATGLRFTPGDPRSLADTMLRILTDERLDRRLSMDARRMLEQQFSWRSIAAHTVDVYRDAIEADLVSTRRRGTHEPLRTMLGASPLLKPAAARG